MDRLTAWVDAAAGFVWGPWCLIPLLLLTGLFLTLRLRGLQFTQLGPALYKVARVRPWWCCLLTVPALCCWRPTRLVAQMAHRG